MEAMLTRNAAQGHDAGLDDSGCVETLAPERWNRALLASIQSARPVLYHGRRTALRGVCFHLDGSTVGASVYLEDEVAEVDTRHVQFPASDPSAVARDVTQSVLQERAILYALQTAHPLRRNGLNVFIHTLHISVADSIRTTTVYLTGCIDPVRPEELHWFERPPAVLQEVDSG